MEDLEQLLRLAGVDTNECVVLAYRAERNRRDRQWEFATAIYRHENEDFAVIKAQRPFGLPREERSLQLRGVETSQDEPVIQMGIRFKIFA